MIAWHCIFADLHLSPSEKKVVTKFLANPTGLRFLPVVTLLKNRNLSLEACELLTWGLAKVPHYLPARVMLGRALFNHGLIRGAWDILLPLLEDEVDNFLALKTAFCCAILLGDRRQSLRLAKLLEERNKYDNEVTAWLHSLLLEGFDQAQVRIGQGLAEQGIKPVHPPGPPQVLRVEVRERKAVSRPLQLAAAPTGPLLVPLNEIAKMLTN